MNKKTFLKTKQYLDSQMNLIGAKYGPVTGMKVKLSIYVPQSPLSISIPKMKKQDLDKHLFDLLTAYYFCPEDQKKNAKMDISIFTSSGKEYSVSLEVNKEDKDDDWLDFVTKHTDLKKLELTDMVRNLVGLPVDTLREAIGVTYSEDWNTLREAVGGIYSDNWETKKSEVDTDDTATGVTLP